MIFHLYQIVLMKNFISIQWGMINIVTENLGFIWEINFGLMKRVSNIILYINIYLIRCDCLHSHDKFKQTLEYSWRKIFALLVNPFIFFPQNKNFRVTVLRCEFSWERVFQDENNGSLDKPNIYLREKNFSISVYDHIPRFFLHIYI